MSYYIM